MNELSDGLALAAALPQRLSVEVELGYRDIDRQFDWYTSYNYYNNIEENAKFMKHAKENYDSVAVSIDQQRLELNSLQTKVLEHLTSLTRSAQFLAISEPHCSPSLTFL